MLRAGGRRLITRSVMATIWGRFVAPAQEDTTSDAAPANNN
jgi:hypothetical protein